MFLKFQFLSQFRMKELNIQPEDRLICFGQLLGMCDNITFPLGKEFSIWPLF